MNTKRKAAWIILISLAILIKVFSLFPAGVEQYYSHGVYPYIARLQRLLLGWIPFSIGDLFYFIAGFFLLRSLFLFIRSVFRKQVNRHTVSRSLKGTAFILLWVYVTFNVLWGLNYNRIPMAQRFNVSKDPYSTADLGALVKLLGDSLNAIDAAGIRDARVLNTKRSIFNEAAETYSKVEMRYPDLSYHPRSVKPSLYSYLGNYLGFSGYYNPFTGEAQVNTTVPAFVQPFVACHEIGHQLGYAKEDEANFSGFLSACNSSSDAFHYSVYFDMYSYARREMWLRDSSQMKLLYQQLRPHIKADILTVKEFYLRYNNPFEPVIRALYAQYLKANQQPKGMFSYNEVIAMLISYYRQQGMLNIAKQPG